MNRIHRFLSRGVLLGSLGVAAASLATARPCVIGTLQSYINLDTSGGCTLNDTLFRFSFSADVNSGSPVVANASEITVTPVQNASGEGLSFSAMVDGVNYFSTPSGSVTYHIDFSVDPVIGGADLSLDPPFGDVSASQTYCLNDVLSDCSHGTELSQSVSNDNPPGSLSSQVLFPIAPTAISLVDISTDVTLNGPAGFDSLNSILTTASSTTSTPEPASQLLVGCGLAAFLGVVYRRRRSGRADKLEA